MHSQKESNRRILRILGVVFIVIALVLLGGYACTKLQEHREIRTQNGLQEMFDTTGSIGLRILDGLFGSPALAEEQNERAISDRLTELYAINPDLIGWLIAGGDFSTPVVWRDNSYYLDHDFYGESSNSGTVFADVRNENWETDSYIVLYGHNMKNGTMFGKLKLYAETKYFKDNCHVEFYSLYDDAVIEYVPFAVVDASMDKESPGYLDLRCFDLFEEGDAAAIQAQIDLLMERSAYDIPGMEVAAGDRILALTTCSYDQKDGRLILFCRALREGETAQQMEALIRENIVRRN